MSQVLPPAAVDALLADAEASGTPIDGPEGLLAQMTKAVLERALDVEIADHLGYEHGDPAGNGSGNSRNGHGRKTVLTTAGPVELEVPRDRNGSFTPAIVPKRQRRLGQVEDMILSLYARGMSTRDITEHLEEVYGATVSAATISRVTDVVLEEIAAWQSRPVDPVYPILYIDAIRIKIRDGGVVANKAAHIVIGVDVEGIKQVLGIWIQQTEGAKFWHGVLTELRNRGCRDALFVCCDGLAGLPESIAAVWPDAVIQTCVVHLLRASMRYASYTDRRAMAKALRPIYTAATEEAAKLALEDFRAEWKTKSPGAVAVWDRAWAEFTPFLAFPVEIRKIIYTTNAIESLNYQLRKVTKARGSFPSDAAAIKLLYLAIRNINQKRGNQGQGTYRWTEALNTFAIQFPDRLPL
ncbi:IS256 family transposase [Mycolicibacter longobardus]|uniref:IS256 family transposase n=1 Tax=Mycolicibacter longobardus TaxID=1108812 RepID=UPI000A147AD8|nr:IS256 family transposase [Mycolicibacter longobardus]MCV7385702.1 IS256 family transposase [Mycolicibacter longobardus]